MVDPRATSPTTARPARSSTFADGLNIPIGLLPLGKGDSALVHDIPNIRRFIDTDGDGKADKIEPAYEKYGFRDTHGMTNAFTWGFDGWIYACHGFSNESTVKGSDGKPIVMQSGNVYRMKPDGSHAEYYSHGQVNPFGLAFDPLGNLYSCDCHSRPIYQLLRGAYYPSFGKPDDGLGFGPEMIGHDHGSTGIGGIAYYAADHFPEAYRDTIFIGNVVTSRINHDKLEWHGSSPKAIAQPDFVVSDDPWFRPSTSSSAPTAPSTSPTSTTGSSAITRSPSTHPGRDRERGRIWRIVYKGKDGKAPAPKTPRPDETAATVAELIEDLGHPNLAVRTVATNQLVVRGAEAVEPVKAALERGLGAPEGPRPLGPRTGSGRSTTRRSHAAATDPDEAVRVHAMRIMAERPTRRSDGARMGRSATWPSEAGRHVAPRPPGHGRGAGPTPLDGEHPRAAARDLQGRARRHAPQARRQDRLARPAPQLRGLGLRDGPRSGPTWRKSYLAEAALGRADRPSRPGSCWATSAEATPSPWPTRRSRYARHIARLRRRRGRGRPGQVRQARQVPADPPGSSSSRRSSKGTQERGAALGPDARGLAADVARDPPGLDATATRSRPGSSWPAR